MARRIPVIFMAFDLLCSDGELTLNLPLRERRNRLEAIVEQLTALTISPLELAAPSPPSRTFSNLQPTT